MFEMMFPIFGLYQKVQHVAKDVPSGAPSNQKMKRPKERERRQKGGDEAKDNQFLGFSKRTLLLLIR